AFALMPIAVPPVALAEAPLPTAVAPEFAREPVPIATALAPPAELFWPKAVLFELAKAFWPTAVAFIAAVTPCPIAVALAWLACAFCPIARALVSPDAVVPASA